MLTRKWSQLELCRSKQGPDRRIIVQNDRIAAIRNVTWSASRGGTFVVANKTWLHYNTEGAANGVASIEGWSQDHPQRLGVLNRRPVQYCACVSRREMLWWKTRLRSRLSQDHWGIERDPSECGRDCGRCSRRIHLKVSPLFLWFDRSSFSFC